MRPALSNAAKAKAEILALEAKLAAARRAGDAAEINRLETARAWAVANSF